MGESLSTDNLSVIEDYVLLKLNPDIYPLDVIYSTSYVFLDKSYVFLSGDKDKEILIELRYKNLERSKEKLEKLGREFLNELTVYSFYKKQSEKTFLIRQSLLQKAFFNQVKEPIQSEDDDTDFDEDYLDDPEGIAIPWEEKYGDKNDSNNK